MAYIILKYMDPMAILGIWDHNIWPVMRRHAVCPHSLRPHTPSHADLGNLGPEVPQRVQVPNIEGLWSQKTLRVWYLEPESLNVGYLDPLGPRVVRGSPPVTLMSSVATLQYGTQLKLSPVCAEHRMSLTLTPNSINGRLGSFSRCWAASLRISTTVPNQGAWDPGCIGCTWNHAQASCGAEMCSPVKKRACTPCCLYGPSIDIHERLRI